MFTVLFLGLTLPAACAPAQASDDLRLGSPFGEGMVLQAGKPVRVWGVDTPGVAVEVELAGATGKATTGDDGRWSVELPAMEDPGPHELTVRGSAEVTLVDVLVGEVWWCSGQSNMAWKLRWSEPGDDILKAPEQPGLRFMRLDETAAETPAAFVGGSWEIAGPETRSELSGVAYFFGRKLQEELDRPVGLIVGAMSGSKVEAWLPREAFDASPHAAPLRAAREGNVKRHAEATRAWEDAGSKGPEPPLNGAGPQHAISQLYNGMTHPLEPLSIAGVLWYQGESNAWEPGPYTDLFHDLVVSWREGFNDPQLPVNLVQLPNFDSDVSWADFRQAQRSIAAGDPLIGMAVTIDVGEPDDLHPRDKQPVGERLARLALVNTYGRDDVIAGSPRPVSVRLDPSEPGRVLATFDRVGDGLRMQPGGEPSPGVLLEDSRTGASAAARVEILSADTVALTSPMVPHPNRVRHADENAPVVHLFNSEGLPVEPFVVAVDEGS